MEFPRGQKKKERNDESVVLNPNKFSTKSLKISILDMFLLTQMYQIKMGNEILVWRDFVDIIMLD